MGQTATLVRRPKAVAPGQPALAAAAALVRALHLHRACCIGVDSWDG
jgi:hypothetical protein